MRNLRQSLGSVLLIASCLIVTAGPSSADDRNASPEKERELIAKLQSDAPGAEKAIACKLLAIHGSSAAVPELSRLLESEQLASWARIALEAIPGPEASAALRQATNSITGRLLVGAINSIGVRRDPEAVDLLIARLKDQDSEVASAAAVALGRIGNGAAANGLKPLIATAAPEIRSAIAEGIILCAERFLAEENRAEAIALYDEVRKADVPRQRLLEATRGAILARKPEAGIALLTEQLRSKEYSQFQMALSTAREFPGNAVDKALAEELGKAQADRAALLVQAMADRKETVILSALLKSASDGAKVVRLSAINALGRVGNETCLASLLAIGAESDDELSQTAKASLSDLQGAGIDKEIVARLGKADSRMYQLLIELVGRRRISAVSELQKALDHKDRSIRVAALTSLGATIPQKNLSVLVAQVVDPKNEDDLPAAEQALLVACIRMPDPEACAEELSKAYAKASLPTQISLLKVLGAVGGTKALRTIAVAAKSPEEELQDASSRLLGEWTTIDAAPVLLDLSSSAPGDKYKLRAIRGYIRILRQFDMPEIKRLEMANAALVIARKPAEQKLILEALKKYPTLETLKIAFWMSQELPEMKDDATQAVMAIAQKLGNKGPEVTEILSKGGLSKVNVEIVKAEYGAGATQKDVTETLQKQLAGLQLISLPHGTYNESFGGDPAPSVVKQLRIQYRINGKDGQATFAENALIVLPMPK